MTDRLSSGERRRLISRFLCKPWSWLEMVDCGSAIKSTNSPVRKLFFSSSRTRIRAEK